MNQPLNHNALILLVFAIEMTQSVLYFVTFLLANTIPVLKHEENENEREKSRRGEAASNAASSILARIAEQHCHL